MKTKQDYTIYKDYIMANIKNPKISCAHYAKVMGCGRNTVTNVLKSFGLKELYDKYHPLYNNSWTSEELESLHKYLKEGIAVKKIAKLINKPYATVYRKITVDNLEYNTVNKSWSKDEDNTVIEYYKSSTSKKMRQLLPGRTSSSIGQRANMLGIYKMPNMKNWINDEIEYIKIHYFDTDYIAMSKHLNRSPSSVMYKCHDLKLAEGKPNRTKLKKEHIKFIIANYLSYTDTDMAIMFNVSESAISTVRKEHGLKKTGNEVSGPTHIEKVIISILKESDIGCIYNEYLGDYKPDFQIKNTKYLIEVQGDYWHCNPYIYPDGPKDDIQIKHVLRDYYKKCYYLSRGYKIIYLWEQDINNNIEIVMKELSAVLSQKSQKTQDD